LIRKRHRRGGRMPHQTRRQVIVHPQEEDKTIAKPNVQPCFACLVVTIRSDRSAQEHTNHTNRMVGYPEVIGAGERSILVSLSGW
jgi:hypothetical protein